MWAFVPKVKINFSNFSSIFKHVIAYRVAQSILFTSIFGTSDLKHTVVKAKMCFRKISHWLPILILVLLHFWMRIRRNFGTVTPNNSLTLPQIQSLHVLRGLKKCKSRPQNFQSQRGRKKQARGIFSLLLGELTARNQIEKGAGISRCGFTIYDNQITLSRIAAFFVFFSIVFYIVVL